MKGVKMIIFAFILILAFGLAIAVLANRHEPVSWDQRVEPSAHNAPEAREMDHADLMNLIGKLHGVENASRKNEEVSWADDEH